MTASPVRAARAAVVRRQVLDRVERWFANRLDELEITLATTRRYDLTKRPTLDALAEIAPLLDEAEVVRAVDELVLAGALTLHIEERAPWRITIEPAVAAADRVAGAP